MPAMVSAVKRELSNCHNMAATSALTKQSIGPSGAANIQHSTDVCASQMRFSDRVSNG